MAEKSGIEWCDHSFNGWIGCSEVPGALGCARCYAREFMDKRMHKVKWGPHGTRVKTSDGNWKKPLLWDRKAKEAGIRRRVFAFPDADVFEDWSGLMTHHSGHGLLVCDSCGRFHADNEAAESSSCPCSRWLPYIDSATMNDVRRELFKLIDATPHLDWLVLTKRPENILRMWPITPGIPSTCIDSDGEIHWERATQLMRRPNCWLGTSIATQTDADRNIPLLLECRDLAPVLFLSCEPLIEAVELDLTGIDWVILGCESNGRKAGRFQHGYESAAHSINQQCKAAGVAVFNKQMPIGGTVSHDPNEWPDDLKAKTFPTSPGGL